MLHQDFQAARSRTMLTALSKEAPIKNSDILNNSETWKCSPFPAHLCYVQDVATLKTFGQCQQRMNMTYRGNHPIPRPLHLTETHMHSHPNLGAVILTEALFLDVPIR